MTNPLSAESQARQESVFDDNLETEYHPQEKRARINLPTTSSKESVSLLYNPHRGTSIEGKEERREAVSPGTSSEIDLEWLWDEESKSRACTLTNHNTEVRFHLDYSCGTAAARGTLPICEGQHYWEIKMVSAVYGTDMMIGLGTKQVNLGKFSHLFCSMLGIDNNGDSCGLSYTGRFHNGGISKMYCSKYGQGAVIGVHLDMWFGTITFFKNGKCLGIAGKGLLGKVWHPMVSSTAARSSMRLIKARSFPSSLQFWCCNALRKAIPPDLNVLEVLDFPPGLRNFLEDNLFWLLGAHNTRGQVECKNKGTQTVLSCTAIVHRQRMMRLQQS